MRALESWMTTTSISAWIRCNTVAIQTWIALADVESLSARWSSEARWTQTLVVKERGLDTGDSMHTWS